MARHRLALHSVVLPMVASALLACTGQATEVWIVTESNLPVEGRPGATSPALRQLQILGRINPAGGTFWDVPYDLRSGRFALPAHVVIRPESDDESRQVRVRVTGHLDVGGPVSQEAVFSFLRGHRLYLRMFLARECIGAAQAACEMRGLTCSEGGRCVEVERRNLPEYPSAVGDASVDASAGTCALPAPVATTASIDAPRLAWPTTASLATTRSPSVRWILPAGVSGGRVEFCRERGCATVIAAFDADGDRLRPACELPPGAVFFRVRGRQGGAYGERTSAVWQTRIPRALPREMTADTAHGADSDVDGDGLADVVLQVSDAMGAALTVYRGRQGAMPDPSPMRIALSGGAYERLVVVGDVNGDGFVDVAGAFSTASRVSVHYGSAGGLGEARTNLTGLGGEGFGTSVGGGDFTGDGYADIVVGAPYSGAMSAGRAVVFAGAPGGIATTMGFVSSGAGNLALRGQAVAGGGDVNGDGRHDFAIATPGDGASRAGAVELRSSTMATVADLGRLGGPVPNDGIARALLLGDLTGDGLADLLVTPRGTLTGYVYFVPGAPGFTRSAIALRTDSPSRMTEMGAALAVAGDFDDDGYGDALVSEGAYPMVGSSVGRVTLYHGASGGLVRPEHAVGDVSMGTHLAPELGGVGDVDGDGRPDVVLVASSATATRVLLYRHGSLSMPETVATLPAGVQVLIAHSN